MSKIKLSGVDVEFEEIVKAVCSSSESLGKFLDRVWVVNTYNRDVVSSQIDGSNKNIYRSFFSREDREKTYKAGDYFEFRYRGSCFNGEKYRLTKVSINPDKCCLVSDDMKIWAWAVEVENAEKITQEEFDKMCGMSGVGKFHKLA